MKRTLVMLVAAAVVSIALVAEAAHATFPGPNGRIVFASSRDGNSEIYSMNPDGSGLKRLTNHLADDYDPAISPDGMRIAFRSHRSGCSDIWVMNADGSNPVRLTETPTSLEVEPAWSPDGSKIAFSSSRDASWEIYVMDADGSNETRITSNNAWTDGSPDWSPDGTKIAYSGYHGITVWTVGTTSHHILVNDPDADDPSWSPDGSKIAYVGFGADIYWVSSNASWAKPDDPGVVRAPSPGFHESNPVWSPEGNTLAFNGWNASTQSHEVYVLGSYAAAVQLTAAPGDDSSPSWGRAKLLSSSAAALALPWPLGGR
jgi:TolB protein